jgi:23S rRNA pseudouridine1911/1915/1917 synthase
MKTFQCFVGESENNKKLDLAIVDFDLGLSRKKIRGCLDQGLVRVNGEKERFASHIVSLGDCIEVKEPQKKISTFNLDIDYKNIILYEDQDVIVINKPALITSQKKFAKDPRIDAADVVSRVCSNSKLILCHRLDKETTGCLVFAKSKKSAEWLFKQFKDRLIKKTYHAICLGKMEKRQWIQKDYLTGVNEKTQMVAIAKGSGKLAISSFQIKSFVKGKKISLVSCEPQTGRTHQLRLQLQEVNLPIVGDSLYGIKRPSCLRNISIDHQLLHAREITFSPSVDNPKKQITVKAPYPVLFDKVVNFVFKK